jgi:hypothetical protein
MQGEDKQNGAVILFFRDCCKKEMVLRSLAMPTFCL